MCAHTQARLSLSGRTHALAALLARHKRRPARRQRDRLVRGALIGRAALAAHEHAAVRALATRRAAKHACGGLQRALQRRDDDHLCAQSVVCVRQMGLG